MLNKSMYAFGVWALTAWAMLASHQAVAAQDGSIGVVIMAVGNVSAQGISGEERQLQRRSSIFDKDLLKTDAASRAQIRLSDGSLISLQENSSFKIDNYAYKSSDKKSDNAAYTLLKGSMRTISGAIGKTNHEDYKVATPVATIGIRGTDYELVLHDNNKGGAPELYGYINDGVINVGNGGGNSDFGFNQFFVVKGPQQPPEQLLTPPAFMFEGYVPPHGKKGASDAIGDIYSGESTGLDGLLEDTASSLPDVSNPAYTPYATVSQLTGSFVYVYDSGVSGGLPSVQNGPVATYAYSQLNVDFTNQVITYAYVTSSLSDGSNIYANIEPNAYPQLPTGGPAVPLADVIGNGDPIVMSGSCSGTSCVGGAAPIPVAGSLELHFVGSDAQGAVGNYNLQQTTTNGLGVSGTAVYAQPQGGW